MHVHSRKLEVDISTYFDSLINDRTDAQKKLESFFSHFNIVIIRIFEISNLACNFTVLLS